MYNEISPVTYIFTAIYSDIFKREINQELIIETVSHAKNRQKFWQIRNKCALGEHISLGLSEVLDGVQKMHPCRSHF